MLPSAVATKPWNRSVLQAESGPPTMLIEEERRMLRWLAAWYYQGHGQIIDAGAFVGGSTVAMCKGLRDVGRSGRIVHSYDLFRADRYAAANFTNLHLKDGDRTRHIYDEAIKEFADLVVVHDGNICEEQWSGAPIELLFLDVLKTSQINDHALATFFPYLIPGHSLVIQQDYLHAWLPWIHVSMEALVDYFDILCDTEINSVVFLNTRPIPADILMSARWNTMSPRDRAVLMDRAIERWTGNKREFLERAKSQIG